MSYCVYKHTTPKGKVYIGITRLNPSRRWRKGKGYERNWLFYRAIMKYGWENIRHEIILDGLTENEAKQAEIELIAKYDSTNPKYGYNITKGGDHATGHKHTQEEKEHFKDKWLGTKNPNARPVICLETLTVYETATEAMRVTGATKICDCCRRAYKHKTSGGFHWAYYEYGTPMEYYMDLLQQYIEEESAPRSMSEETKAMLVDRCRKEVICVETGKIYPSLNEAARAVGASPSNICNCCKGIKKTVSGYRWRYA